MAEESEKDFKARMILECSKEVIELKKTEKPTEKQLKDIMKKYEDKIYEKLVKKPVAASKDDYDTANLDIRHPFTGDASFLSNYNKLLRGYREEANFNSKKLPYEVKLPSQIGIYQPKNQFPIQHKSYSDTQANSKYYFPQDHDFDQFAAGSTGNIYNNKPINDISNIQSRLLAQYMRPGLSDPYAQEEEINHFQSSEAVASGALLNSQQNMPSTLKISQQNFAPQELLYQNNPFEQQALISRNTISASPTRRSRSPVKYETPTLNQPHLYISPTKRNQPLKEEPIPELPKEVPKEVPVLEDKDFGQYKKPNFYSSRAQRDEKIAQLNSQYQMLQGVKLI